MPSTLHRLFTFAKATRAEALENFTTEALAAAITDDPAPLVAALAHVPGLQIPPTTRLLRVDTQVPVDGGTVDLVVAFDTITYWFEVKAHGGLHGDQLATYRRAIADDTSGESITAGIEHDDAVAWFRARMSELKTVGILGVLPEFRRAPDADPADEVDAES
ncbi:MAG: hypothetical protein IPH07_19110 [Deltaproteobacteria bacterium]|nr:hypothetical protein [Deltaproteobacteria bacterium]MBK8715813.1 hypothetical protein [Deltaproteobacteria bacterium]MBP7291815.1 hypothetical protein [Nannocystaceae bacterium]